MEGWTKECAARLAPQNLFYQICGGKSRFEGDGADKASGGLDFFATGDEVAPVGALDEDIGKERGDEFAGGILVEERDGVDGFERGCCRGASAFGEEGARGTFHALDGGVGIESEDQDVAHGAGLFEEADVSAVEEIVTAVGEDDAAAGGAPGSTQVQEVRAR
jgi:hypothetical protein